MNSRYIYFRNELFPSSKGERGREVRRWRRRRRRRRAENKKENKEKLERRDDTAIAKRRHLSFEKQRHHNGRAQWHEARPSNKIKLTSI